MREEFTALSEIVYIEDFKLGSKSVSRHNLWVKSAFAIPVIYFLIIKSETIIGHYNSSKLKFAIDIVLFLLSAILIVIAFFLYLLKFSWHRKIDIRSISEIHLIPDEDNIETIMKIFTGGKRYKPFIFRTLEGEHLRLKDILIKQNSTIKIVEEKIN